MERNLQFSVAGARTTGTTLSRTLGGAKLGSNVDMRSPPISYEIQSVSADRQVTTHQETNSDAHVHKHPLPPKKRKLVPQVQVESLNDSANVHTDKHLLSDARDILKHKPAVCVVNPLTHDNDVRSASTIFIPSPVSGDIPSANNTSRGSCLVTRQVVTKQNNDIDVSKKLALPNEEDIKNSERYETRPQKLSMSHHVNVPDHHHLPLKVTKETYLQSRVLLHGSGGMVTINDDKQMASKEVLLTRQTHGVNEHKTIPCDCIAAVRKTLQSRIKQSKTNWVLPITVVEMNQQNSGKPLRGSAIPRHLSPTQLSPVATDDDINIPTTVPAAVAGLAAVVPPNKIPSTNKETTRVLLPTRMVTAEQKPVSMETEQQCIPSSVDACSPISPVVDSGAMMQQPLSVASIDPRANLQMLQECRLALVKDEDGDLPIHIAVAHENIPVLRKLIEIMQFSKVSIDTSNKMRQTPLHLSVITNQHHAAQLLLAAKARPGCQNNTGDNCFHLAAREGNTEMLTLLLKACLERPANIDAKNYEGLSPLHEAAQHDHMHCVKLLISCGANINISDGKSGKTALFYAVENRCTLTVQCLLQHGAQTDIANYSNIVPEQVAASKGLDKILQMLAGRHSSAFKQQAVVNLFLKQRLKKKIAKRKSSTPLVQDAHSSNDVRQSRGNNLSQFTGTMQQKTTTKVRQIKDQAPNQTDKSMVQQASPIPAQISHVNSETNQVVSKAPLPLSNTKSTSRILAKDANSNNVFELASRKLPQLLPKTDSNNCGQSSRSHPSQPKTISQQKNLGTNKLSQNINNLNAPMQKFTNLNQVKGSVQISINRAPIVKHQTDKNQNKIRAAQTNGNAALNCKSATVGSTLTNMSAESAMNAKRISVIDTSTKMPKLISANDETPNNKHEQMMPCLVAEGSISSASATEENGAEERSMPKLEQSDVETAKILLQLRDLNKTVDVHSMNLHH